jgi:hypothetical protein
LQIYGGAGGRATFFESAVELETQAWLERWREGVPLERAVEAFTRKPRARKPGVEPMPENFGGLPSIDKVKLVSGAVSAVVVELGAINQRIRARRETLLEKIRVGELEAFGFASRKFDVPRPIPVGLVIYENIDWGENLIAGKRGGSFSQVRVARRAIPSHSEPANEPTSTSLPQPVGDEQPKIVRKMGRPPVIELLVDIVRALKAAPEFASLLRKEQVEAVREIARSRHQRHFPKPTHPHGIPSSPR